jgi:predicted ester cyclase
MHNAQSTLLYRWFNEVWNSKNENAIDDLMTEDATAHGLGDAGIQGAPAFKAFFRDFNRQFRDVTVEVDDVITEDGIESARTTVHAIHNEANIPVHFTGICMVKVTDGKIAEAWNNYDFLNMYQQLGQKVTTAV